jgi:hypothetical protein
MFGDKLTAANAKINALVALIVASGFQKISAEAVADPKTEASALPSVDDFKAHLQTQQKAAVDAAVSPLNAQIAGLNTKVGELAGKVADADILREGITGAGVKLGDFVTADKAEGKTPEDKANAAKAANVATVKGAIETAIASKSAKQIAASGHPNAIDVPAGKQEETSASNPGTPENAEEFKKNLRAIKDPGDRQAYYRKHKAKFGL